MKKFFVIFGIFALVFLVGCGDSKITKDGCTIGKSFGTHSLTRKDVSQTCVKEIAAALFPECGWQSSEESASDHIAKLQRLEATFGSECKDKNDGKTIECPDFIPKSLKLTKLSGCEVYSIDPHTDCIAPCADLYFSTDNDIFKTVYAGSGYSQDDNSYDFIKSSGEDGVSLESKFTTGVNKALFSWSEKGEDSTEIKKEILVKMKVVDPVTGEGEEEEEEPDEETTPAQCVDNKGKTHDEGDKIPDECRTATCTNGQWHSEAVECYNGCWGKEVGDKMKWLCDDGVTEVDWCTCDEIWDDDGVSFTLGWGCYERVDLNCPNEE
ncbi:hypothetical protein IKS86_01345 [bacterium]|nr:hypothetical protein [bacterium]